MFVVCTVPIVVKVCSVVGCSDVITVDTWPMLLVVVVDSVLPLDVATVDVIGDECIKVSDVVIVEMSGSNRLVLSSVNLIKLETKCNVYSNKR